MSDGQSSDKKKQTLVVVYKLAHIYGYFLARACQVPITRCKSALDGGAGDDDGDN